MRIAVIVGINYYEKGAPLFGCVDDAHAVKAVLERHDGGAVNFDCRLFTGTGPSDRGGASAPSVSDPELRERQRLGTRKNDARRSGSEDPLSSATVIQGATVTGAQLRVIASS